MGHINGYSVGVSLCCGASVSLVAIVYVGMYDLIEDLVPLIALSVLLHVTGLFVVLASVINFRWRAERRMYYDWGL